MQYHDVTVNPIWWTTAILKIVFWLYISTTVCTIKAKFGMKKHNHVLTQVTSKYQIWNIQDGGRPPFWKWFYRSVGSRPTSMIIGSHTQIMLPRMVTWQSEKKKNGGRPSYWKSFFDYISTIYCLINAKFRTKKQITDTGHWQSILFETW